MEQVKLEKKDSLKKVKVVVEQKVAAAVGDAIGVVMK